MPSSARIVVTASGWVMYGSPLLRFWSRCHGRRPVGALDEADVSLRMSRANRLDQRFEHRVHPPAAGRAEPGQAARGPSRSRAAPGARAPAAGRAPAVRRAGTRAYPGRLRRITARGVTGRGICAGRLRDRRRHVASAVRGLRPWPRAVAPCPWPRRPSGPASVALPSAAPAAVSTGSSGRAGVTPVPAPPARCHVTGHRHSSRPPGTHSIGGRSGQCRAQRLVTQPAVSGWGRRAAWPARRGSSVP